MMFGLTASLTCPSYDISLLSLLKYVIKTSTSILDNSLLSSIVFLNSSVNISFVKMRSVGFVKFLARCMTLIAAFC